MTWIQQYKFSQESEDQLKEIRNCAKANLYNDINPLEWMFAGFYKSKQIDEANRPMYFSMKVVADKTKDEESDKIISEKMEVDIDSDLIVIMTQPFTCSSSHKQSNDDDNRDETEQQELCIYENLKENFHSATAENIEKVIDILRNVPVQKVTSVCNYLQLAKLGDVPLSNFLSAVITQIDVLGFNSIEQILRFSLGEKSNASRHLISTLNSVSKTLPSQVLTSVAVPLLQNSLNNFQHEVLCRLVKDGLSADYRASFLISICKETTLINEPIIAMISIIIDSKISLTSENLTYFIKFLQSGASNLCSNLKFAKLLQSIVKKYEHIFLDHHAKMMGEIVNENTTFLKNSLSSALKKFS